MSPERSKSREYVTGASAALIAKLTALTAGFVSLWLLNQILSKQQYGSYAFAMAMVYLLTLVGTSGLDRTLLYRLSRTDSAAGGE